MKLNDFTAALRRYPAANELSVLSDGGYYYMVVDASGKKITPAELGVKLDLNADGDDYVWVDGNIYSHTATITPSDDNRVDVHVKKVTQDSNLDAIIVEGDIP